MKRLIEEVSGEGLDGLLGEIIEVWCVNYIYTGKLVGVNNACIKLESASIVYETGSLSEAGWKDAQPLPQPRYIQISAIESFAKVAS